VSKDVNVFQLVADGVDCLGNHYVGRSSTVFTTLELAEKRKKKFRDTVCDPSRLIYAMDDDTLKIEIMALLVVE